MKTTLNKIRACAPCAEGWKKLLKHLGKRKADDEPLNIKTILESNGLDDALWCLRAVDGKDKEIRLYAVWCAQQVQHLMADQRSLDALDVAESFANGLASKEDLMAAGLAARGAWDSARVAAWNDARNAARNAARAAASAAAWDAAGAAAGVAAWDAAQVAAKEAQTKKLIEICEE